MKIPFVGAVLCFEIDTVWLSIENKKCSKFRKMKYIQWIVIYSKRNEISTAV